LNFDCVRVGSTKPLNSHEWIRFRHWTNRLVIDKNQLIILISGRYCALAGRNAMFVLTLEIFFGITNIAMEVSHFVRLEDGGGGGGRL